MTDLSQLPQDSQYENPSCGDWIRVQIDIDGETVTEISFDGEGCSLSIAAASMMTEFLKGMTISQAIHSAKSFETAITESDQPFPKDEWKDLYAFDEIRAFPIRQKCVLLPFRAFRGEIEKL